MTDDQVITRAEAAGWLWLDAPNRWGGVHGWQMGDHSFKNCSPEPHDIHGKITVARRSFGHDRNCAECGRPKDANWDHVSKVECFDCNFWLRLIRETDAAERVVVGGVHFIAGGWYDEPPAWGQTRSLGFGGRKFVVRFTDGPNKGKTLTTYSLWHQGPIPERFRDRLPDNAEFVENTSAVQPV